MNRLIHPELEPSPVGPIPTPDIQVCRLQTEERDHPYALFMPLHYESSYRYPLVVWLHGPDDNELQLKRVMPLVSMRNYLAIGPRGTASSDPDSGKAGYAWKQTEDHILLAEQRVFHAIDLVSSKFSVAPSRVFLAGFDCGGTMALRIALNHPGRFAGAITLGGRFPRGHRPLGRLNEIRGLPMMLANGLQNECYPESHVCEDLKLFHAAGLSATLRQYPCGNELTTIMLSDMDRWIMQQVCPNGTSTDEPS